MSWPEWTSPDGRIRLINADCLEVLPTLDGVDAVVTDPPYGLGERMRAGANNVWSKCFEEPPTWDAEIVSSDFICSLPPLADCIIWGGNYYPLPPVRGWLAWDKDQEHSSGHFELAWTNLDIPTRKFRLSRVQAYSRMNKQHPTQKPIALMEWCLSFVPNAQTILDPFAGSFTTAIACIRTDRRCIAIEKEPRYFQIGIERCKAEYARTALFDGVAVA